MLITDLFNFAYVPDWYGQLEELKDMALPESWQFKKTVYEGKNTDTPILERYIHIIFRKQSIDFNTAEDTAKASTCFHVENECACFHMADVTVNGSNPNYEFAGIYADEGITATNTKKAQNFHSVVLLKLIGT